MKSNKFFEGGAQNQEIIKITTNDTIIENPKDENGYSSDENDVWKGKRITLDTDLLVEQDLLLEEKKTNKRAEDVMRWRMNNR